MTQPRNLTGLTFGRLTALRLDPTRARRSWICACSCGNITTAAQTDIVRGDTASCGCLRTELTRARNRKGKVNVANLTPNELRAYKKWRSMRTRVSHPTGRSYRYSTVTIEPSWDDFYVFLSDMGVPPPNYSLERMDNSKGYGPKNCKWIPVSDQQKNTRRNRLVSFNGKTKILSDHARDVGLRPDVVFDRVNRLGWTEDRALSTPKREIRRKNKPTELQMKNLRQIADAGGVAMIINEENAHKVSDYLSHETWDSEGEKGWVDEK